MNLLRHNLAILFCLLGLAWPAGLSAAVDTASNLPPWRVLEFEQKVIWATARSRIAVHSDPNNPGQLLLNSTSSVASALNSNIERLRMILAQDGSLRYRTRFSSGKNKRLKSYEYLPERIERQRRDPVDDKGGLPHQWPVSSEVNIQYPALAEGKVITDAYTLMLLASRFYEGSAESAEVVVQTDFNFYRVEMRRSYDLSIPVAYQLTDKQKIIGSRDTRSVQFIVEPLGELADKPDFSFLGLQGQIMLLFDKETGIPVQLRGDAPRIGSTTINLKKVTLRETRA